MQSIDWRDWGLIPGNYVYYYVLEDGRFVLESIARADAIPVEGGKGYARVRSITQTSITFEKRPV